MNPHPSPPVSIVVLTYNEEVNIAECLASVSWCDDVHVLDSGSQDRTAEIARSMGAKVWVNPFKSFGDQRNWAIDQIPCKHKWHFHLDADERFTDKLAGEIADTIGPDGTRSTCAAYLCPSKMIFLGKWLKYSGSYPAYQVRLFHRDRCRFMDYGHGQREATDGEVGRLIEPYIHYNFSKGLHEWLTKHNGYSSREAGQAAEVRRGHKPPIYKIRQMEPVQRRRAMKSYSYFLPMRSLWRFVYIYFGKLGFLDGMAGLRYAMLLSMYEYWIEFKTLEIEQPWNHQTVRLAYHMAEEG